MHAFAGLSRAFFLCFLLISAGCELDSIARFEAAAEGASVRFGEDARLEVSVSSGRVASVEEVNERFEVATVAGGPFPTLTLNNGTTTSQSVTLTIGNVNSGWSFNPRLNALPSSERKAPDCATESLEGRDSVNLAPATPSSVLGTTVQIELELPACAQIELRAQPAPAAALVRIAVVGELEGSREYLSQAVARAADLGVDYIQFLGDVAFSSDQTVFAGFEATVQAQGVPYGVVIAPNDTFAPSDFVQRFGGSDYVAEIGQMRWIALDTASGELSDEQVKVVTDLAERRPPGIFLSSISLLDFDTTEGLRSTALGTRMVEELASRGVLFALSAGGPEHTERRFGEVNLRDLAGAGAEPRSVAIVEFRRPWPELASCTTSLDCETTGFCNRGFCRARCESTDECGASETCAAGFCTPACSSDADCSGPLATCADGACELDPEISVSLSRL